MSNKIIERPFSNGYCNKCKNNIDYDECKKIKLGMSNGYCPSIVECRVYDKKGGVKNDI